MSALPLTPEHLSLNRLAEPLVDQLLDEADTLGLSVHVNDRGTRLVDAGLAVPGSLDAGLLVARICMANLGQIQLRHLPQAGWPTWVEIDSAHPVLACLGSQYAGWSLSASKEETGGKRFFALGSGPARALAGKEALFDELRYQDRADRGVLVLEVDRVPPTVVIDKILADCHLPADGLTLIVTPTTSPAGTTQVVARALEVALHKAHELHFPLENIVHGRAMAPLPVPSPDGLQAMGRTNDAILYGGQVHLTVRCDDDEARQLAMALPSSNSPAYGRSFADVFEAAGFDFYQIDPALFAPAEVWVSNQQSGHTFHAGQCDMGLLRQQWLKE